MRTLHVQQQRWSVESRHTTPRLDATAPVIDSRRANLANASLPGAAGFAVDFAGISPLFCLFSLRLTLARRCQGMSDVRCFETSGAAAAAQRGDGIQTTGVALPPLHVRERRNRAR